MSGLPGRVSADEGAVFRERLNWLFEHVHPPRRGVYSNKEVAARIAGFGGSLSDSYISLLRTGKRVNPSTETKAWLARAFGFPRDFFDDDDLAIEAMHQFAAVKSKQAGIESVLYRMIGLSEDGFAQVLKEVDRVRELEGLPPEPE
ncbi:XRE family transcriptional regulator [Streptomyces sp. GbtcB7]|uniref:XRE family transcriptional regulator n=1 Tax=Streptomyces sp. GbtcB7 TaxID=2824752 RepID=UPI001C30B175|nr:XRE family transcriptional regulator [Streptomyces sp. GbtcB7]